MHRIILSLIAGLLMLSAQAEPTAKLIASQLHSSYSKEDLQAIWADRKLPERIVKINSGIDVYYITYETEWHDGSPIKATGYYFVPKDVTDEPLPALIYHHGTQIKRNDEFKIGGENLICAIFAADGYAVIKPDYIGLGGGEKFHLYHHVQTTAMSSINMFRAVQELNMQEKIFFSDKLFLTGYSQGGHATMAVHKVMQEQFADEFTVTASAPLSGAYDMNGAQRKAMFEDYSHPGYLPYILRSMNEAYQIYPEVWVAFKEPYDSLLPPLYDGNHSMGDINKIMPDRPVDVIKDELIEEFENNPDHPLMVALEENSTVDWKPEAPMLICYCESDEQVFYKNALNAYDKMHNEYGLKHVKIRHIEKSFGHNTCAPFAAIYTKWFFDSFVAGSTKGKKGPLFHRFAVTLAKGKVKRDQKKKQKQKEKEKNQD